MSEQTTRRTDALLIHATEVMLRNSCCGTHATVVLCLVVCLLGPPSIENYFPSIDAPYGNYPTVTIPLVPVLPVAGPGEGQACAEIHRASFGGVWACLWQFLAVSGCFCQAACRWEQVIAQKNGMTMARKWHEAAVTSPALLW